MTKLRQELCDARSRLEESQCLHDELLKEVHDKSRVITDLQTKVSPTPSGPSSPRYTLNGISPR